MWAKSYPCYCKDLQGVWDEPVRKTASPTSPHQLKETSQAIGIEQEIGFFNRPETLCQEVPAYIPC